MGSPTGMSPMLSPEPLKMSLPSINCCDSKTNGRSLNTCSPPPASWSSLHAPSQPPPLCRQGPLGHPDLIRLCPARRPHRTVTDEGEGGLINVGGWRGCSLIDQSWSNFPAVKGLCTSRPGLPWNGWKSPVWGLSIPERRLLSLRPPMGTHPALVSLSTRECNKSLCLPTIKIDPYLS